MSAEPALRLAASQPQLSDAKRRLLEKLRRGEAPGQSREDPVPGASGAPTPLAPIQQHVWLHSEHAPGLPLFNEPVFIHYRGRLDRYALGRAFHEVLRRHEILRTSFVPADGEIVQTVHDRYHIEIPFFDLTDLPREQRETRMLQVASADVERPFDLAAGPLVRPKLFRLGPEDYRLYLAMHHIILDGVTLNRILLPQLAAIYEAFSQDLPSPLPEPRYQYGDFALWQTRLLRNNSLAPQREFWRKELAGNFPTLQLPSCRQRPAVPSHRGGQETFVLPAGISAGIRQLSQQQGATAYMLLLAVFKALLFRYSGQPDLLVGSVADGRVRPEFESVMGYFLSTVVLRTRPLAEMTFREYLAEVKSTVLGALANAGVPFDQIEQDVQPQGALSRHSLFQVMFSMRPAALHDDPRWSLTQFDVPTGMATCDLHLSVEERGECYTGHFFYGTDMLDAPVVRRMAGHWLTLLSAVLRDPDVRLADLPVLTAPEQAEFTANRNRTHRQFPAAAVHQLFEGQAARRPRAIAVECDGLRLSYRELNEEANRLARRLTEEGVRPDSLVAIRLERSFDQIISLLAIFKAGGGYLPIDPALPSERQRTLLAGAQPALVITSRNLERPPAGCHVVYCDEGTGSRRNLDVNIQAENLAYALYTPSSTDNPAAVEVSQGGLANVLHSLQHELKLGPSSRVLALTPLSFDSAVVELLLPLISGGRIVLVSRGETRDPELVIARARESRCNVMQATPAIWRTLIDAGWQGDPQLQIITRGEDLARDLAEALLVRCRTLWSARGHVETTVYSTFQEFEAREHPLCTAKLVDNTEAYVLDQDLRMVPKGVAGELYIGGPGLARGYRGRPELTRERFVTAHGCRLYRTGDRVRWNEEGLLEYVGANGPENSKSEADLVEPRAAIPSLAADPFRRPKPARTFWARWWRN